MTAAAVTDAQARPGYRYVVVWMLAIVYTLNFLDRQIVAILGKYISADLHLTKTQFGLMGGTAFAVFYTVCGIPVAYLADRWNRIWIMSGACAVWSLFTAGCGATTNFIQIGLCRMGVGIGEAGGSPPSYSLISDYFPPSERGTGLAIYSLGVPLGSMIGAFVGGRIAEAYGWRMAFYAVGLPGVLVALLLLLVVREPRRGGLDAVTAGATAHEPAPPLMTAIGGFFANRTLLLTAISSGLSAFVGYAGLIWNPQFLELVKGMSGKEVANYYSLTLGVTGVIGTFGAGWLVDKLTKKDRRWFAWVPAIAFTLSIPFWIGMLWAPTWQITMLFLAGPLLLNSMYLAPALAVVQNAVTPGQRTMAGAILLFVLNLVGLGVGPVYVGRIADAVEPQRGHNSLAIGFAALIPIVVLTVGAHIAASMSIARDKRLAALVG
ncbi:MAG: MFS transporter [Phenylobacterium sp.]|nr:MAG: MFS transporter [Phenylobacterium sp.]